MASSVLAGLADHTTRENHQIDWEGVQVVDKKSHRRRRQGVPQKEKTGSPTEGEDRESHRRRRQGVPQKEKTGSPTEGEDRESHRRRRQGVPQKEKTGSPTEGEDT